MDHDLLQHFREQWQRYFPGAELPIVFYYSDKPCDEESPPAREWRCIICDLGQVRKGKSLSFDIEAVGCGGGKRYFGFSPEMREDFDYFLSCGIPGKMDGERYKKTPELVQKTMENQPFFKAPGKYIVFKRWDKLDQSDTPLGVIFFARPDVLSGLFTLANFEEATPHGVISPSCAGCSAIVYYPYIESQSDHPRAVLGMFDTSARPCVPPEVLTFSVPFRKFVGMVENMDESNLTTGTWNKVKERIGRQ